MSYALLMPPSSQHANLPRLPRERSAWLLVCVTTVALSACAPVDTNPATVADDLAPLGLQLFFDPRLSADGNVSCATCHDPERAFADGKRVSVGVFGRQGTRNAPSLLDLESMASFFWDGREQELISAVLQPFTNEVELGHESAQAVVDTVQRIPEYQTEFSRILGRESLNEEDIGMALMAYLGSLDRGISRYEYAATARDWSILSSDELTGLRLFESKAQCDSCHLLGGKRHTFTDNRFHHAGIGFDRIAGNLAPLLKRIDAFDRTQTPLGHLVLKDRDVAELGRFASTHNPQDLGAYRTPSLRNVANTAPYMHDGSVATLEDAIERELYYRGITLGRPINLTVEEQHQLAAFLRSLSVDSESNE